MATILLVHGMKANEKSWFDIPEFLTGLGHSVVPVLLPGHDGSFYQTGNSTTKMADYISEVASHFPESGEEAILIGHSMGGQVITHVAAKFPERVSMMIYVAAMLPQTGQSANDIIAAANIHPLKSTAQLGYYLWHHPEAFASQPRKPLNKKFQPPDPSDTEASDKFKAIRRFYVLCKTDEILPTAYQKVMVRDAGLPDGDVEQIESDHIPQINNPVALKSALTAFLSAA